MIRYLNPFFDLVDDTRDARLDQDHRARLEELRLARLDAAAQESHAAGVRDAARWSAVPGLPIYMTKLDLVKTELGMAS